MEVIIGQQGTAIPTYAIWRGGNSSLLQVYTPATDNVWQVYDNADSVEQNTRKCYWGVTGEQTEKSASRIVSRPNNMAVRYWRRRQ